MQERAARQNFQIPVFMFKYDKDLLTQFNDIQFTHLSSILTSDIAV